MSLYNINSNLSETTYNQEVTMQCHYNLKSF